MANTSKSPATRAKRKSRPLAFPLEFRLRIVKLYLEEGYSRKLLVEQFGISTHSIQRWVRAYRLHGAAGLEPKRPVSRKSRVAEEVRQQAVAVKAEHPEYGLAGGSPAVAGEKRTDQDPEGGRSVTQFLAEKRS